MSCSCLIGCVSVDCFIALCVGGCDFVVLEKIILRYTAGIYLLKFRCSMGV